MSVSTLLVSCDGGSSDVGGLMGDGVIGDAVEGGELSPEIPGDGPESPQAPGAGG